jgi:light-regulated signal transduction histidine kinase (bacteriophytochrome)
MNAAPGTLQRDYLAVLEAYLQAGGEAALSEACELGRRAMAQGLGVLDMAQLHAAAVEALVLSAPAADQARRARAAADVFKDMLSPFEMSFRGYRDANEELQRLNETLRRQKAQLELANGELEAFSYSVSHDLRNPISGIDGLSLVLLERAGIALDEGSRTCLQMIREAALQMRRLVDDLMSLARVGRAELRRSGVDLGAIAAGILARLQAGAPARAARVHIQPGLRADADPNLMAVALENLLGNAWKYSARRACAQISVGCEEHDGMPVYFVTDNGAGFDMAHAGKLFKPFQRLHSEQEFEGTGIGLSIVQRIVDRHGGRIWAEGRQDAGATFRFTLGAGPAP